MPQYALVPNEATSSSMKLWVGCRFGAPSANLSVRAEPAGRAVPLPALQPWPSRADAQVHTGRVEIAELAADATQTFILLEAGNEVARCEAGTLPTRVGSPDDPLIVFLGSCFCRKQDRGVGAAITGLPAAAQPHVKILAGDQVYLDAESRSWRGNSEERLREIFLDAYWATWTSPGTSLAQVLARGPNWFMSEDHEFWNNYPYRNAAGFDTWLPWGAGKDAYKQIANELYERFQSPAAFTKIDVSPVSFALLDTRRYRDDRKHQLCRPDDFKQFAKWVGNLSGPGVLVTGQPIFGEESGLLGTVMDLSLPDYDQYEDVLRALAAAHQPIILLSGDVHFGRIANTRRRTGPDLVEIIASPLALVPGARGRWHGAPAKLRWADRAGLDIEPIQTSDQPNIADEHFVTLELTTVQGRLDVALQYWLINGSSTPVRTFRSEFTVRS